MKTSHLALVLITCLPLPLLAGEPPPDDDKDTLMALLDEQTAIATRTRMNADYVPGMVTVLHGDDLEARGARTVWEALALVPGMETAMERTGRRKVLVRGLGNTWASGNVKILLNDVSMNAAENGLADPVYNIPVEQIDRIEVIRGPGSAIYGEYAYMGVINVVTRGEENRVFALGGSYETHGAGAVLNFSAADSPLQASLNLAGWRSSGADVNTGEDLISAAGIPAVSNAPGPANEDMDAGTAVFKVTHGHFALTAQWSQDGLGDFFGASYCLPPHHNQIVQRIRHRTLDMREELPVTSSLTAGVQLSWKDVERRQDQLFLAPAMNGDPAIWLDSSYLETTKTLGTDLTWRREDNTLLVAASVGDVRVERDRSEYSVPLPPALTLQGNTRQITAFTVQDEYRHSDLFTLTTGVRYDEYSDADVHYSPRIAGVWRLDSSHIVKAQYAEAFRPPTLLEVGTAAYVGQPKPAAATIRTSEVGYIQKSPTAETRLTVFHSRLDDLVVFYGDSAVANVNFATQSATAYGAELERGWRVSPRWALDGNLSYVDTEDEKTGANFPGAATWLANARVNYKAGDLLAELQAHYVSNYFREEGDPRTQLAGYTTVDLTATVSHLFTRGLQLRVGIKNLFNSAVRYPAPLAGVGTPAYPSDFPQAGRNWWAQVGYGF